jgi:hypothetical protein
MPKTQGKRILSVRVRWETDSDPDLSFIGEYASRPGPDDRTIDREERGDVGRNEYRYFIAAMSGEETGNPESVEQDYRRMEDMNRGDWQMLGCWCEAEVVLIPGGPIQTIRSGGLCGIESDSGDGYLREIEQEQASELREQLKALGYSDRSIGRALKEAKNDRD